VRERSRRRLARYHLVTYAVIFVVLALATVSMAQVPRIFPTPTPAPETPQPEPTFTPPPQVSASPTPAPVPTDVPIPTPSGTPAVSSGPATPTPGPGDPNYDKLPPGLDKPITLDVPVIPRTRPRNTYKLVDLLEPLTEYGIPLDQLLVEGMGRFPVAGRAWYFDDWLNPRYHPTPHLHHGLDIFADFGTPIRAPDGGVISALTESPDAGGIGVWMRSSEGVAYYFAHLLERVEGLHVGQPVQTGTVIGFVGDTGNARGGSPHVHFEIHPGGGPAAPPKPSVDRWLDEAEELAPRWVESRRAEIEATRQLLGDEAPAGPDGSRADLETSMLLTLLDPVGGSVGLLPRLELAPARPSPLSSGLLLELIRLRLDGYLFVPSSQGLHLFD
jgi:hypothetical protein